MRRTSRAPAAGLAICMMLGTMLAGSAWADEKKDDAKLGFGVRMRYIHIPKQAIELFVERSAGSGSHPGIGFELIREKGDMAITLGFEYESIAPRDGIYIEKGDTIPEDAVDDVEFKDFTWVSADISFIGQQKIVGDVLALRYGAGLGVGYIMGDMLRTDATCLSDDVESCQRVPGAPSEPEKDLPPVFPIVNVLMGLQVRPFANVAINIEGGIRTVPFVGTTVAFLF
jgi:hypothetical protein